MDSDRFDAVVRALATSGSRRRVVGGLVAAAVAGLYPGRLAAQEEIASAGNGGTADAAANGGGVATGNVNSGANTGSAIGVGDTAGGVAVDGGSSTNATSLEVSADGGTAIADASGGDDNEAAVIDEPEVRDISSPPDDPVPPAVPPEPPLPTCVPRDEVCTRGGMGCCSGNECITGDSASGICLAVCGEETTRCNEQCVGFCDLDVPHAGGCDDCVCRAGQVTCTLGTQYPLSDTCCLPDQECCRVGPIEDPGTVNTCCSSGTTCNPGVGCV